MKILIADDQELVRETIAAFLRQDPGFTVDIAADLPGALAAVRRDGPYDLVMLDYMMPGMNGLEGLAVMRAAVPGTAVGSEWLFPPAIARTRGGGQTPVSYDVPSWGEQLWQ